MPMHRFLEVANKDGVQFHGTPRNTHKDVLRIVADIDGRDQIRMDTSRVDLTGNGAVSLRQFGIDEHVRFLPAGLEIVVFDIKGPR